MTRWCYVSLSVLVVLLHQLAQTWMFGLIEAQGGHIVVLPFFNLVEVWNTGISFGMFNQLEHGRWSLSAMAVIITAVLLWWLSRTPDRLTTVALCLVIGGGIGNIIDRVRFGAVADYFDLHVLGYHWPAFNVTDCAIVCGVILLLLSNGRTGREGAP